MTEMTGTALTTWRRARGWDRSETARRLRQAANGTPVADYRGLVRMIRSWEVGEHQVSERYELLFRSLGFPDVTVDASDIRWLAAQQRSTRRLVRASIALGIAVLVLGALVALLAVSLNRTAASTASLCRSGNVSRTEQVQLWDYILGLSAPPKTAADRERVTRFRAHLAVLFAPRNCSDVNPASP